MEKSIISQWITAKNKGIIPKDEAEKIYDEQFNGWRKSKMFSDCSDLVIWSLARYYSRIILLQKYG